MEKSENNNAKNELKVQVNNEWDKLKTVMLGDITNCEFPKFQEDWGRYSNLREFMSFGEGKLWVDRDPVKGQKMIQQMAAFEKLLKEHGVEVIRPEKIPENVRKSSISGDGLLYARDPHLVIGKNIIQTNMRMSFRQKEHHAWSSLFQKISNNDKEVLWLNMPDMNTEPSGTTPEEWSNDARLFVEGGDTFVIGKDILVGFSSLGSSVNGINWLRKVLARDGYRVHTVPLSDEWLHLDCMFAVIKEGLAIAYLDGFKEGLPEVLKDWDIIEATAEECHVMGSNTICLEPGTVFIGSQHKRLINEIEKKGCTAIPVDYDLIEFHGGGIRCTTHPIFRK